MGAPGGRRLLTAHEGDYTCSIGRVVPSWQGFVWKLRHAGRSWRAFRACIACVEAAAMVKFFRTWQGGELQLGRRVRHRCTPPAAQHMAGAAVSGCVDTNASAGAPIAATCCRQRRYHCKCLPIYKLWVLLLHAMHPCVGLVALSHPGGTDATQCGPAACCTAGSEVCVSCGAPLHTLQHQCMSACAAG